MGTCDLYDSESELTRVEWILVLVKLGSLTMSGGDIINATNRSSDSGFGGAKRCIRSGGIMPLDDVSRVAEASRSSTNGFNLRFVLSDFRRDCGNRKKISNFFLKNYFWFLMEIWANWKILGYHHKKFLFYYFLY